MAALDARRRGLLSARLSAQLLTARDAHDPLEVVGRLLAVQAQDPRGFRLAVRARSSGLAASDVDHCLTEERSLVVDWLNRGTLHLVAAEDHAWLHSLTAPRQLTSNARRLAQEGVDAAMAERGVATVSRALREDGPQTRSQLRERLASAGVRTEGQALVHVLGAASLGGLALRGPVVRGEQAFADPQQWLGHRPAVDPDLALVELARRYLAGHGPAGERDLAYWAGIPVGRARTAIAGVRGVRDAGGGLAALTGGEASSRWPEPVLLGPFDPLLHGWASRELVVPHDDGVVTSNGVFRPVALVSGRVVATWRVADGSRSPLPGQRLVGAVEAALDADGDDVRRFLDGRARAATDEELSRARRRAGARRVAGGRRATGGTPR